MRTLGHVPRLHPTCIVSTSERMDMERSRCWGCGAIPQEGGAQLQACSLCRSEGLPPCFFCSEQCLRAAWPHHREWHREQERLHGLALQMAARHWSLGAAAPCSAYDELLSAMGAMSGGAMSGQCDHPSSVNVGSAGSGDVALAVATFLLAAEQHTDPVSLGWSERCIAAYALRSQPDCLASGAPAAPWWTDVQLVSLSARVVGARPDLPLAWRMRGEVLSGRLGRASWRVGPRSPEELEEAGHALQVCTPSAPALHPLLTMFAPTPRNLHPLRSLYAHSALAVHPRHPLLAQRALTLGQHELAEADKETLVRQALMCFRAGQTMRDAG